MTLLRAALLTCLLVTAQPVSGGKPAPTPGTSTPEIGYVKISGGSRRFYEFKMSNEDGTGASTVFSSRDVGSMVVDLGPRAAKSFLMIQGGKLSLGKYKSTSTGVQLDGALTEIINMNHVGAAMAKISNTGQDVVYFRNATSQLWRYNVASRTHSLLYDLPANGAGLTISPDGQTVYFTEEEGPETFALKSIPMAGGTPTDLNRRGYFTDISAANTRAELVLVDIGDWPVTRMHFYDVATGTLGPSFANGTQASYKCDDSRLVYQQNNAGGGVSLLYYDIPSGAPGTLSRSDLYRPDYIPTC